MALGKALCLRVPYAVRGCLGYCLAGASRRGGVIGQNPACSRLLYASKALWGEEKVTHTGQVSSRYILSDEGKKLLQ